MKFSLQNKRGILTRAAYFIIGMALVMGAFFTGLAAYEFFQWDPLGEYPIQVASSSRVDTEPLPGGTSYAEDFSIPVIYWDEDMEEGNPRTWITTSFRIIHENAPREQA